MKKFIGIGGCVHMALTVFLFAYVFCTRTAVALPKQDFLTKTENWQVFQLSVPRSIYDGIAPASNRAKPLNLMSAALRAATGMAEAVQSRPNGHATYAVVGNGARLVVDDAGGLALSAGSTFITALGRTSGLWIRDAKYDAIYPVGGKVKKDGNAVVQSWTSKSAGLSVEVRYEPEGDHFRVTGRVMDTTRGDRGIDVVLALSPAPARKGTPWLIWSDFQTVTPLPRVPVRQSIYPLAVASQPQSGRAFALAIPPSAPAVFESEASKVDGVRLSEALGITHDGTGLLAGGVPFAFDIYPVDAEWGMRDALARYYAAYPTVFKRRTNAAGLWLHTRIEAVPNPTDYAFREGGPSGTAADEKEGVKTFPYVIVGQRELVGLPAWPKTYAEMMSAFENATVDAKKIKGWGADIKDIIKNSGIFNTDGKYCVFVRRPKFVSLHNDSGAAPIRLTFPLNPNPKLFADDSKRMTVAKAVLGWVDQALRSESKIDGIYVDALGSWGHYLNYRRDHFPYEKIPLTYGPGGDPAIDNEFSELEFLRTLARGLHKRDKLVWGNGISRHMIFDGFALDVLSLEIGRKQLFRTLRFARTVADQKPFLVTDHHDWLDPNFVTHYWRVATLYDVFPTFDQRYQVNAGFYKRDKPIIDRYLPILRQLSAAGWQPVTDATLRVNGQVQPPWTRHPQILIERYGSAGKTTLYFTLYNQSSTKRSITLRPDKSALGGLITDQVMELIQRKTVIMKGGTFGLTIPGHALRVIVVKLQE